RRRAVYFRFGDRCSSAFTRSRRAPPYAAPALDASRSLLLGTLRLAGELLLHTGRLVDEAEADPLHHRLVLYGAGGTSELLGRQSRGHLCLRERAHLLQIRGRPWSVVFTG